MCVAIAKTANSKLPKEKYLYNCWSSNRDGIGVAWARDGKVYIKKGFESYNAFTSWFYKNIHKPDSCLIHFRMATSGNVDAGNAHPFPVTSNPHELRKTECETDLAVIHNGVIHKFSNDKKYSDTQLLIEKVLAHPSIRPSLLDYDDVIGDLIGGYIGSANKLAFLNNKGLVYLIGDFTRHDDVYYSNHQYEGWLTRGFSSCKTNYGGFGGYYDDGWKDNYNSAYDKEKVKQEIKDADAALDALDKKRELPLLPNGKLLSTDKVIACDSCNARKDKDSLIHVGTNGASGYICRKCFSYDKACNILVKRGGKLIKIRKN